MAILYKHFPLARTVLCTIFCAILLLGGAGMSARAADTLFTVEGVSVDVTADDAAKARQQAFEQAQANAFGILAGRMVAEGEAQSTGSPDPTTISTMIKDFEITDEKISRVQYIATYTFRFDPDEVRRFFGGQGVGYTDVTSKPVLVLPFYQAGVQPVLWDEQNPWMAAWKRTDSLRGIVPIAVPIGDLEDVNDIGGDAALTYDEASLRRMLSRYNAGEAIMLLAVPDANLASVYGPDEPARGALSIHVYRTDGLRPEHVNQIDIEPLEGETKSMLYTRAVEQVRGVIQRDWKAQTVASPEQGNSIQVKVRFGNLHQWAETQSVLSAVRGVEEVKLQNLARDHAIVELIFQGAEKRLRLALAQADITLTQPRIGFDPDGVGATTLLYELYLSRYKPEDMDPAPPAYYESQEGVMQEMPADGYEGQGRLAEPVSPQEGEAHPQPQDSREPWLKRIWR